MHREFAVAAADSATVAGRRSNSHWKTAKNDDSTVELG
jgi:hypothetical protein